MCVYSVCVHIYICIYIHDLSRGDMCIYILYICIMYILYIECIHHLYFHIFIDTLNASFFSGPSLHHAIG